MSTNKQENFDFDRSEMNSSAEILNGLEIHAAQRRPSARQRLTSSSMIATLIRDLLMVTDDKLKGTLVHPGSLERLDHEART